MAVTIILVVLIVGFAAVTIFALSAMLVMRRREKEAEISKGISKSIDDLDEALNSALNEINKLGALIQTEVDEKYKAVLFLYNLLDEKKNELPDNEIISEMFDQYIEKHGEKISEKISEKIPEKIPEKVSVAANNDVSPEELAGLGLPVSGSQGEKKPPEISNAKHKKIWDMRENGKNIAAIAKELDMGTGEVKLILDLIDRAR
ncbi:MAG: hypothetical protein FWD19_03070 [Defluviitaleaceae bacterium]|nr:hypothetical protein [Defluviitaleaceae bacterium]